MTLLRIDEAAKYIGVGRTRIWQLSKTAKFPAPVKLGERARGFLKHELDDWLISQKLLKQDLPTPKDGVPQSLFSLTESQIIAASKPMADYCGIYFLLLGTEIVYVGQSKNILMRVSAHFGDKQFNRTAFIPFNPAQLNYMESHYIHRFKPRLNAEWEGLGKRAPIAERNMEESHG